MLIPAIVLVVLVVLVLAVFLTAIRGEFRRVVVFDYQRGLFYRNGRLLKLVDAGRYWTSGSTQIVTVDTRKQLLQLPGQEILTADGVTVKLSATLEYGIKDPALMVAATANLPGTLYAQAQLALRTAVAELAFEALLTSRAPIGLRMEQLLKPVVAQFGVELAYASILDIMLPADIRRAYTQALTAQREGTAALERARGESASLRSLANAARLLQDHPGLLQLRALQAVEASKSKATLELRLDNPSGGNPAGGNPAGGNSSSQGRPPVE